MSDEHTKPNRHYHVHLVSNGLIMVRELMADEIPKDLPFLGDPGFDNNKHTHLMGGPGELAHEVENVIRALRILDPKETSLVGMEGDAERLLSGLALVRKPLDEGIGP